MEIKNNEEISKTSIKELQQKGTEILAKLTQKAKSQKIISLKQRREKEIKIRATIPITISPESKKKLRELVEKRVKKGVNVNIDLKDTKEFRGNITILKESKKELIKINIETPVTPEFLSSPKLKEEGPLNKNILREKVKRILLSKQKRKKGKN